MRAQDTYVLNGVRDNVICVFRMRSLNVRRRYLHWNSLNEKCMSSVATEISRKYFHLFLNFCKILNNFFQFASSWFIVSFMFRLSNTEFLFMIDRSIVRIFLPIYIHSCTARGCWMCLAVWYLITASKLFFSLFWVSFGSRPKPWIHNYKIQIIIFTFLTTERAETMAFGTIFFSFILSLFFYLKISFRWLMRLLLLLLLLLYLLLFWTFAFIPDVFAANAQDVFMFIVYGVVDSLAFVRFFCILRFHSHRLTILFVMSFARALFCLFLFSGFLLHENTFTHHLHGSKWMRLASGLRYVYVRKAKIVSDTK